MKFAIPSDLERAFARMAPTAEQNLRLTVGNFSFKARREKPERIQVFNKNRKQVGSIAAHWFEPFVSAPKEVTDAVLAILMDVRKAAMEHGLSTGSCACCGRVLTDPASLALGIGPICLHNFGWADDDADLEDL